MTAYTFDQLITFTRTSAATYVGSNGLVAVTPASRNLLTYTQDFDNAAWVKLNTAVSGVNAAAAPDDTLTADLVREAPATFVAYSTGQNFSYTSGSAYIFAVYLKKGSGATAPDWMQLTFGSAAFGTSQYANFNLATGAVGTVAGGFASIQSAGNGWYRCAFTATATATATTTASVVFCNNSNASGRAPLYTGATTSDVFIWGAQLETVPDANLVLGSELRGGGVVSTAGSPSPLATYNTTTGEATLNRVDGSNVSGVRIPVGGAGRSIRVSVTIAATTGTVQVRGNGIAGTILGTVGSTAGTYLLYVVSDTADIYLTMSSNATTASITVNSVKEITGTTGMPTTYTRNNGGVYPPRFDYDPVTRAPRGLLIEEQRTNLLLRSEEFDNASWTKLRSSVTANATTSPDGTVDADKLVEDTTASDTHLVSQGVTLSAVSHTFTAYVKAAERSWVRLVNNSIANVSAYFNVGSGEIGTVGSAATASITNAGNGWYRCSIAFTASAGTNNMHIRLATANNTEAYTGDGTSGIYLWGAQLEAGPFATSYIPTVASQVTRTADVAAITAPMFAPWYRQSEGTLVMKLTPRGVPSGGANVRVLEINDGGATNRNPLLYSSSAGSTYFQYRVGGVDQAGLSSSAGYFAANTTITVASAYAANDFAASFSGSAATTDNSGSVVTNATQMTIGYATSAPTEVLCGHIQSIDYYPTRLTNAQIQALTA